MARNSETSTTPGQRSRAKLREVAGRVLPSRHVDFKDYLLAAYRELKGHFGGYSFVSYSEDLGFGACSAMHLISHGKRPLTRKAAVRIAEALGLHGIERKYFLALVDYAGAADANERQRSFARILELKRGAVPTELDRQQLAFFSDWWNAAILELLAAPEASDEPAWLAAHLKPQVPLSKVESSLSLLRELGYVERDERSGRWTPAQGVVSTGPEVQGVAVASFHGQMIDLAKASMAEVDPRERDISGVSLMVTPAGMERLKDEVQAFRRRLIEIAEESMRKASGPAPSADGAAAEGESPRAERQVLQVNVQLFPLSKRFGKAGRK